MAAGSAPDIFSDKVRALAAETFILGFPLLLVDALRRAHPPTAGRFLRQAASRFAGLAYEDAYVVRTSAWIDLADGPVAISLPHLRGRYCSVTLIDAAGLPFASLGSRTGEAAGGLIAVAGPRWSGKLEGMLRAHRAPSDVVWAVSRILAHSDADRPTVAHLAASQFVTPLHRVAPHVPPPDDASQTVADVEAVEDLRALAPATIQQRLHVLLGHAPGLLGDTVQAEIAASLRRLESLRDAARTDTGLDQAMRQGFADGLAAIESTAYAASEGEIGGWRVRPHRAPPAAPPLARASALLSALGAPLPEDVLVLTCATDATGRPLTGTQRYRLRFEPSATPPVETLWRLAVRPLGGETAWRGAVNDHCDFACTPDGSLELFIQAQPPDHLLWRNWLAAPAGEFELVLRLYWPQSAALAGAWRMPPVERLDPPD